MITLQNKLTEVIASVDSAPVEDQVVAVLAALGLDPLLTDKELNRQLYRGRRGLDAIDDSTREIIAGMLAQLRPDLGARRVDSLTESMLTEVFDTPDLT